METNEIGWSEIRGWAWDWRHSVMMLHAHDLGIFEAASNGWVAPEEVAIELNLSAKKTYMFMLGLSGMGLLKKAGSQFKNSDAAQKWLVKKSPDYRGALLDQDLRALLNWTRMPEYLRTDDPIPASNVCCDDEIKKSRHETFIRAMDALAKEKINRLFAHLPVINGHRMLDIGCGPGTYMITLARRLPDFTAVCFDKPATENIFREKAFDAGVMDRLVFQGGDFTHDDFMGGPFDGVLLSQILRGISCEKRANLIKRVSYVTKPGGFVAIHDMTMGPDEYPGTAAIFAVQVMMMGHTEPGVHTIGELSQWMVDAGLEIESVTRIDSRAELLIGRKAK